ncbi:MAG: ADP-ribosylation factor-like protein, partial [Candidatus Thorarchaeota archaeon]
AEKDKFNEAEEILEKVLEQAPREAPFLFLANKIDLKNAFKFDDIVSIFRLRNKLKGKRPFNFFQISALRGDNVDDALDWLRVQLLEFNLVIDFKTKQIPQLYEKYEKEISEILAPIVNDSNLSSDEKLSKLVSVITSDIIHREDIKEAWQKNELQIYFENALEILEERKKNKE